MPVDNVTCHQVGEQRLAEALDDIEGRAFTRWHSLRYGSISPTLIRAMADELLDHVAARTVTEPGLDAAAGTVAVTAAESAGIAGRAARHAIREGCQPSRSGFLYTVVVVTEVTPRLAEVEADAQAHRAGCVDAGVINQGLLYLAWLMDHRAEFEPPTYMAGAASAGRAGHGDG
ncbi:hypothetical protein [Streptomyces sp. GESEQ-4]|uniref:hypothetical protein n=1 Tax=Streptomyces sp. GESEQ-4 TaxID=2812655 RepID=UPI001FF09300